MKTSVGIIVMAAWISLSLQDISTQTTNPDPTATTTTATTTATTATTTATTATTTATTATTTATGITPDKTTAPSAPVDPNQRPVNASCQATYTSCKNSSRTTTPGYCAAYKTARDCIEGSKNCNPPDNATLQFFDCGPEDFYNVTITSVCRDRVTECLAEAYAGRKAPDIQNFKTVFCAVDSKEACIKKESGSSKCNANEVTVALKMACSAPQALLSSTLFISLAFILQRLLKDY